MTDLGVATGCCNPLRFLLLYWDQGAKIATLDTATHSSPRNSEDTWETGTDNYRPLVLTPIQSTNLGKGLGDGASVTDDAIDPPMLESITPQERMRVETR